ncbi:uncharacterized protein N7459_003780 [Penicillium hispanicum]|uniref:uncharacterized protein n=1 Tax=Penicillium hispanicum TaxID=1080232 RepID=UPI0025423313|nr:uncharacterized protein N7459_003780 [Penicillium hispanicum]KAJ5588015.1 hypothetical protein N7459_003780 [Penicillium hispanicum]
MMGRAGPQDAPPNRHPGTARPCEKSDARNDEDQSQTATGLTLFYLNTIDEPRVLSKSGSQPIDVEFMESTGRSIEPQVRDSCRQIPREVTSRLGPEKDVCQFAEPGKLHGFIASPSTSSYTHSMAPILSFGRMSAFGDILIPCPCYVAHPLLEEDQVPLEKKAGL